MALVKFGAGISEMRGKEGGVIYSRNAYGSYIKTKVSPINPQTGNQMDQRTLMGNLAQSWQGLTQEYKSGWDNLGAQTTRINRFGDNTTYTGFSLYMRLNRNLVLAGVSAINVAPVAGTPDPVTFTSLTAAAGAVTISLAFTPTVPADTKLFVYCTDNIMTGRRFVKNYYRLIGVVAAAATSPQSLANLFSVYFGHGPTEGAQLFCKIKFVNAISGWDTVTSGGSCIVAA